MLLDEREGLEVADLVVQRRRALEVREQHRDVLDAQSVGSAGGLGMKEVPEGLRRQQFLARQKRVELDSGGLVIEREMDQGQRAPARRPVLERERRAPARELANFRLGRAV